MQPVAGPNTSSATAVPHVGLGHGMLSPEDQAILHDSSRRNAHRRRVIKADNWHSVDYEEIDNAHHTTYHSAMLAKRAKRPRFCPSGGIANIFSHFFLAGVIGAFAGLYYFGMYELTSVYAKWRFAWIAPHVDKPVKMFGMLVAPSLAMAAIGLALTFWEPSSAGSGMPEVIAYLNGIERPRYLSWRTLIGKAVGTVCIVNSGLFTGYDGPLIHICVIGALIVIRNVKKVPFFARWLYGELDDVLDQDKSVVRAARNRELQLFGTIGAAAGMAAAFQAPLAGVCFAIEEAISFYDPKLIMKTLFACAMALVAQTLPSTGVRLNGNDFAAYAVNAFCNVRLNLIDYSAYLMLGVIGGVTGHLYNVLVAKVRVWRRQHRTFRSKAIEVFALVILTNVCITAFMYGPEFEKMDRLDCTPFSRAIQHVTKLPTSEDCTKTCEDWTRESFNAGPCIQHLSLNTCVVSEIQSLPKTQFRPCKLAARPGIAIIDLLPTDDDLAQIFLESGAKADLPKYLFTPSKIVEAANKVKASDVCYYQMPSLVLNQPKGIVTNMFLRGYHYLFQAPVLGMFLFLRILELDNRVTLMDPGAAALLGMCAFWSGTSRMMITILVIAVQATGDMTYINGVTLVVLIAALIGNQLGESQFHLEIEAMNLPFLPHHPPYEFKSMTVKDMLLHLGKYSTPSSHPPPDSNRASSSSLSAGHVEVEDICLTDRECTVGAAVELLTQTGVSGFPVTTETGQLPATGYIFEERPTALSSIENKWRRSQFSAVPPAPTTGLTPETEAVSIRLEVSKQMNRSPLTVRLDTSANKAYNLFRHLGLRHLVVVEGDNEVVNMLTRIDFSEMEHHQDGRPHAPTPTTSAAHIPLQHMESPTQLSPTHQGYPGSSPQAAYMFPPQPVVPVTNPYPNYNNAHTAVPMHSQMPMPMPLPTMGVQNGQQMQPDLSRVYSRVRRTGMRRLQSLGDVHASQEH
ncbi:chloride channel [Catenaria anguillulae PL171]|uniref:Chloride channel protein n=1 Tax=Catenaria anguillulae PL171 TaxID=765915 RepID=A0A1Y2HFQ1_9FUNG|nr:chloride channel [Catenaria anguillulae PL171]